MGSRISIPLPSASITLAVLLPFTAYLLHRATTFPSLDSLKLQISPGLYAVPQGPDKDRLELIYPEDLYGSEGGYAPLPYGRVKYSLLGPENGKKVVLIHGWSTPSPIFKDVAEGLSSEGFRVLVFDLYGRGYSDAPNVLESTNLYTTQLALLMQYVGWTQARVIGMSMGGSIAATFAAQFPHLIDRDIVFICATGNFPANYHGRVKALLTSPLAVWLSSTKLIRTWKRLPNPPQTPDDRMKQLFLLQVRTLPHFIGVLASSARRGPFKGASEAYRTVGKSDNRVLIIHGTADARVPYHPFMSPILTSLLPQAKVVTMEDVGHEIATTHPKEVTDAIVAFFNDQAS